MGLSPHASASNTMKERVLNKRIRGCLIQTGSQAFIEKTVFRNVEADALIKMQTGLR